MSSPSQIKDSASRDYLPARQLARRLIDALQPEAPESDTAPAAAAAGDQIYRALSRWVGADGCHALFARALTEARTAHPALVPIQLRPRSDPYIDGVVETVRTHGDPATAEGLESMLVRLVELLGRLIGEDMATNLISRSLAEFERADATFTGRRERV